MAVITRVANRLANYRVMTLPSGPVSSGSIPFTTTTYYQVTPPKRRGTWISINNGRFRLPTSYSRSLCTATPLTSEHSSGDRGTLRYWWENGSEGGVTTLIFRNGSDTYLNSVGVDFIYPPNFLSSERNEATTKCLNKIADQKVNVGENLATLAQTVRLFVSPTRKISKSLRDMHTFMKAKGIPSNATYRLLTRGNWDRRISEAYLAYVYGLKPLMQDLYGVAELAKQQGREPLLLNGRGVSRRTYQDSSSYYENDTSWDAKNTFSDMSAVSRTNCTLWAHISDNWQGSRTLNQLGLINPLSLIWELVPYSFLIDWVLPIGPVLQALTAPAGLDFVGGSVSRRVSLEANHEWKHNYYSNVNGVGATNRIRYDGYNREVITSWPRPGLWLDPDPLRLNSDGSDRIFKGLALAVLALPRR